MKLLLKRWLIATGTSIPVAIGAWYLVFLIDFGGLDFAFFAPPIIYYVVMIIFGIWICKLNVKHTFLVVLTSPVSIGVHYYCYSVFPPVSQLFGF